MSSSNSLDVEQKFTVFVDRAPIPDEGNSLVLIIVIVVIVLLVVVITGMIISVVIMFATSDCNVKYGQIFEIVFFLKLIFAAAMLVVYAKKNGKWCYSSSSKPYINPDITERKEPLVKHHPYGRPSTN